MVDIRAYGEDTWYATLGNALWSLHFGIFQPK